MVHTSYHCDFLPAASIPSTLYWVHPLEAESYVVVTTHLMNAGVNLKCSVHLGISENDYPSILSILLFYCYPNNRHGSLTAPPKFCHSKFHQMTKKNMGKLSQLILINSSLKYGARPFCFT